MAADQQEILPVVLLCSDKTSPADIYAFIIPDSWLKLPGGLIFRFNSKWGNLKPNNAENKRKWKHFFKPTRISVAKIHFRHRQLIIGLMAASHPRHLTIELEATFVEWMLSKLYPCLLYNHSHQIKTVTIMEHMGPWFIGFESSILLTVL